MHIYKEGVVDLLIHLVLQRSVVGCCQQLKPNKKPNCSPHSNEDEGDWNQHKLQLHGKRGRLCLINSPPFLHGKMHDDMQMSLASTQYVQMSPR